MNKIRIVIVSSLLFVITASFGVAGDKPALDSLIVYGEGFAFGVREPQGWVGDIQNSHKFGANIIFYRKSETIENAKALIRILVAKKPMRIPKRILNTIGKAIKQNIEI